METPVRSAQTYILVGCLLSRCSRFLSYEILCLGRQRGTPGGFAAGQGFTQGALYEGSPFHSQTAGSNPFG